MNGGLVSKLQTWLSEPAITIPLGGMPDILDDQTVPYAVKRSSRAKHVRLEVRVKAGLTVVIPGFTI